MVHVTMIHGICRKPDEKALRDLWRRAVAMGPNGIDLGAAGATSSMVYWADVLYPAPDPDVAAYENASEFDSLAHDVGVVGAPVTLEQAVDPDWIARLGGKLLLQEAMVAGLDEPAPEGALGPRSGFHCLGLSSRSFWPRSCGTSTITGSMSTSNRALASAIRCATRSAAASSQNWCG
jgi:hypothetical protein